MEIKVPNKIDNFNKNQSKSIILSISNNFVIYQVLSIFNLINQFHQQLSIIIDCWLYRLHYPGLIAITPK